MRSEIGRLDAFSSEIFALPLNAGLAHRGSAADFGAGVGRHLQEERHRQ